MRLFSLAILASGALVAQDDAVQLLRRVAETYKNLKVYHFESDSSSSFASEWSGSWTKGRMKLVVASPDRVRFEQVTPQWGQYTVVSDGKTLWRVLGQMREYSKTPLSGPLIEVKGGGPEAESMMRNLKSAREGFWEITDDIKSATILREELFDLGRSQVLCSVVRVERITPRSSGTVYATTETLWIDKQRTLVLQREGVSKGNLVTLSPFENAEIQYRTRYSLVAVDQPLDDSLFTYAPPESFREVATLERVFGRAAAASAKEMIGKPAPELTANTLDGTPITLSSLRGKPVLLDFWAVWCAPCRAQLPSIAKLYSETKGQGLVVLGVNDDETPEIASKYFKEKEYDWPSLFDGKIRAAREQFKVESYPTLVLIDKQGQIVDYQTGTGPESEKAIRAALRGLGLQVP